MANLLTGIRVLDLTRMLAGPYATLLLADLGAEVIKVEEPEHGDEIRRMGPPFVNGESPYFLAINRNKKSLALDLKIPEGREIFYNLVRKSDMVVDNFRPGTMERLKCDYNTLAKINSRVICCSITSFGEDGPLANLPAFDLIIQAYSGAMSITGEKGGAPVRMGIPLGDLAGGMYASLALCAALNRRNITGRGEYISISLLDAITSLLTYVAQYYLADGKVPGPQGSCHMSVVPYGAFRASDNTYFVVAVFTEKFWKGFCRAIGNPGLADDPRYSSNEQRVKNRGELEPMLERIFLGRSADEWLRRLREEGIPCAPINTIDRVLQMEQLKQRGMILEYSHPVAGKVSTIGSPVNATNTEKTCDPPPLLGMHTSEILTQLLGMTKEQVTALKKRGIVA